MGGVAGVRIVDSGPGNGEGSFMQVRILDELSPETAQIIKEGCRGRRLIIEGDLGLESIRKYCGQIQPYAWSVRDVIGKSSRRVDYEKMKKYIREISLW